MTYNILLGFGKYSKLLQQTSTHLLSCITWLATYSDGLDHITSEEHFIKEQNGTVSAIKHRRI